jgi:hypothetical protein
MFSKKELKLAYAVTIVLLAIAVISYAAFPVKSPHVPLRMMFYTNAGKVLFDHQEHSSLSGYGLSCGECHHTLSEGEYDQAGSCAECHDPNEGDKETPKLSDAFHSQCIGCHQDFGAGPVECAQCHVR